MTRPHPIVYISSEAAETKRRRIDDAHVANAFKSVEVVGVAAVHARHHSACVTCLALRASDQPIGRLLDDAVALAWGQAWHERSRELPRNVLVSEQDVDREADRGHFVLPILCDEPVLKIVLVLRRHSLQGG